MLPAVTAADPLPFRYLSLSCLGLSLPFLDLSPPCLDLSLPFIDLPLPYLDLSWPVPDLPLPFVDRPRSFSPPPSSGVKCDRCAEHYYGVGCQTMCEAAASCSGHGQNDPSIAPMPFLRGGELFAPSVDA